jgi:transketolase C-terminal domain/subunit
MFADNGLSDVQSWLYFPADALQMVAVIERVFFERGLRFIFSTRSKVPYILKEDGQTRFFGGDYKFVPGKDDTIVDGKAGYVVSFGEMLYRSWDAVLRCREQGLDVGLINKATLNLVDEEVGSVSFVSIDCSDQMDNRPSGRSGLVRSCLSSSLSIKRPE